jgi:hypothetical protein
LLLAAIPLFAQEITVSPLTFNLGTVKVGSNAELTVLFPELPQAQPVAHDWSSDGNDDIGLFLESGEWFLDVDTDLSSAGTIGAIFDPQELGAASRAFGT